MSYAQAPTMLSLIKQSKIIHLCCGITFFMSGVIINLIQFLLFITVRTVSKSCYRKINWYLNASIFGQLVFMADWWANFQLDCYADKDDLKYYGKEHAYCIMNHTYEIDWLVGWVMADKINLLGNCKAYIKKELQYMPVLGWAWKMSDFIVLNRSFEKDKDIINTQISELGDYPDPMWILMFSEGTRFTEAKHQASEQFAREKNLAPLKHHLQPRTRGFVASLPSMQGKVPAVYDIMVVFREDDPVKPTVLNFIQGKAPKGYIYIKRIPMEDVPKTPAEQEKFLYDMYVRKDKIRESFIKTGDFFATSGVERVEMVRGIRRLYILINFVTWNSVILFPMLYYLITSLFSGELLHFSIAAGIIIFFILMLYKIVGMSKISKGSTYGTNSPKKTK